MRIRWSRDPDELPGPGEALARLRHTRVETVTRTDGRTMTRFAGYQMSIETHDGRSLVADVPGSESAHAAPLVASDAPGDLRELLNRAWLARQRPGRRSEQEGRIEAIVQAVRAGASTRLLAAHAVGRVDEWGQERSDYRRDIRAAGGWNGILRRAGS